MTREEYCKIHAEKTAQIFHLKSELSRMKKEYINEHKQIENLPAKIHFVQQYKNLRKETVTVEADAYIVGYDIIEGSYSQKYSNKVFPLLKEAKKNGEISMKAYHYTKCGTFKFWEIGKEDTIYEIDFGD